MTAAVVRKFKEPLVIEEVPVPSPEPGQILVKIEPLQNINQVFARMRAGDIEGRIVIDFQR